MTENTPKKPAGPELSNRRKSSPKPAKDFGRDSAEIEMPTPEARKQEVTNTSSSARGPKEEIFVVQLNTRVAHPYKQQIRELSFKTGKSIRTLVEEAFANTYGLPEELQ